MTDPHPSRRAFVAFGANLDQPEAQVRAAAAELAGIPGCALLRFSSLYRSEPIGVGSTPQPDYINAVAEVATRLTPHALLAELQAIEVRFGRRRDADGGGEAAQNAARTLDLDLLLVDDLAIDDATLTLPHPRMHLRAFVVAPLVEIAPEARIPGRGLAIAWLPQLAGQRIERLAT